MDHWPGERPKEAVQPKEAARPKEASLEGTTDSLRSLPPLCEPEVLHAKGSAKGSACVAQCLVCGLLPRQEMGDVYSCVDKECGGGCMTLSRAPALQERYPPMPAPAQLNRPLHCW